MLEVRSLTKRFLGAPVVDRVSFSVRAGEISGYLSPNGSGKSTTVKMMTGLVHPSEGKFYFRAKISATIPPVSNTAWATCRKNPTYTVI